VFTFATTVTMEVIKLQAARWRSP